MQRYLNNNIVHVHLQYFFKNLHLLIFFKKNLCFCVCKIHGLISSSNKCNMSCSSDGNCSTENDFYVYKERKYHILFLFRVCTKGLKLFKSLFLLSYHKTRVAHLLLFVFVRRCASSVVRLQF